MVTAYRVQRILDAQGQSIELRTPPIDLPRDAKGLPKAPPVQLYERGPS